MKKKTLELGIVGIFGARPFPTSSEHSRHPLALGKSQPEALKGNYCSFSWQVPSSAACKATAPRSEGAQSQVPDPRPCTELQDIVPGLDNQRKGQKKRQGLNNT